MTVGEHFAQICGGLERAPQKSHRTFWGPQKAKLQLAGFWAKDSLFLSCFVILVFQRFLLDNIHEIFFFWTTDFEAHLGSFAVR